MRNVLFVCTQNAGRSQMAQAFFDTLAPEDMRAESAGRDPRRAGVWPNVIEAMREIGIDLTDRRPQKLTIEMQLHADWAVTLACGAGCPYVPTTVEDWDLQDPAGLSLSKRCCRHWPRSSPTGAPRPRYASAPMQCSTSTSTFACAATSCRWRCARHGRVSPPRPAS